MTCVVAFVAPDTGPGVLGVATAMADLLGAAVRSVAFTVDGDVTAETARAVGELDDPDAVIGAMTYAPRDRELLWALLRRARKPVVVVPDLEAHGPASIARALVPLDATTESASAVAATMDILARAGVDIVVLHVLDPRRAPAFWDHPGHADAAWKDEFLARYCHHRPDVRMTLRSGVAEESIADVARDERVDLVALAWSQRLDPGRARIVRSTLRTAAVPVLLVPVT